MVFQELRQTRIYMVNHAAIKENFPSRESRLTRLLVPVVFLRRRMGTTGLQLSADVPQKMSFAPQFEITNSITAELTRIERARGFLDAAKLSEDWIAGMQKRALVLEAHHTTHSKRSVSTSGRSVGGCGRWPDVGTYESVHLGNKWTRWDGQSLRENHRDDGGQWESSAGSSNRL